MADTRMEPVEILGMWETIPDDDAPTHSMVLDATQLTEHWRRCSLTSDFWAQYLALSVPTNVAPGRLRRDAVEGVLSYLFNELFENSAKFSAGPVLTVHYRAWIRDVEMVVQLTNHIRPQDRDPFRTLIQEILEGDPAELYFQKVEENVALNLGGSGLGYLTLIKDYGIRFGFRFRPLPAESIAVDVQAHVGMQEDH